MPPSPSCRTHPAAAAGWSCTQCHAQLCPACTASKRAQTVHYPVCTLCGGPAAPLRVPRAARSYAQRLRGVWRYPLSPAGLLTIGAAGLIVYVLSFLGNRGAAIGVAILWSYVFTLIRRTANGDDSL
ncbi:MAG TPA: hypothetical protein VFO83_10860, partial [Aggregicoccus sp.]|nr:hypothetical protein [Aggregicoccus sp.]